MLYKIELSYTKIQQKTKTQDGNKNEKYQYTDTTKVLILGSHNIFN